MVDILNIIFAFLSIGLGAVGWLMTGYTMNRLDLHDGGSGMGKSEIRAASGALFVGLGIGALLIGTPAAYAMIGCAWGGAAVGRATSLALDGVTRDKVVFFAVEAVVGIAAVAVNLS